MTKGSPAQFLELVKDRIDDLTGGVDAATASKNQSEIIGSDDSEFDDIQVTDSEMIDWLSEHDQAWEDCCDYFGVNDLETEVDSDAVYEWICDHDRLYEDFMNHFGITGCVESATNTSNMPSNSIMIDDDVDVIQAEDNTEWDPEDYAGGYTEWKLIDRKSVQDTDGFWTDYSLWYNEFDDEWVCMFGDTDIYYPENGYYDAGPFELEEEAREWFDNYESDDDIESSIDPQIDSSVSSSKITQEPGPGAWGKFLDKIEDATGFKVDSAYRRDYSQWIELIDPATGKLFEAEITKYFDGSYEFMMYNLEHVGEIVK